MKRVRRHSRDDAGFRGAEGRMECVLKARKVGKFGASGERFGQIEKIRQMARQKPDFWSVGCGKVMASHGVKGSRAHVEPEPRVIMG